MLSHPSRGPSKNITSSSGIRAPSKPGGDGWSMLFSKRPDFPTESCHETWCWMFFGCFLDVFWMFFMTFRDVLWRLVGHLWCLNFSNSSMPVVSPQSPWWKPPYLLAMYCHCGLPRIPGSFPFQAALKETGAKALQLIEGFPRIAAKSKACDGGGTTDGDGNRCGYPIYESVGQIRHGFFGCAKRQRPQQILDLANRYGWGWGCHMLCTIIGDHWGFWELCTARMIKII